MYTRCPSCRAEISFEPPVHADSLPDGYKHKIKCPSCGVTIGVKIPRHEAVAQPAYNPNPITAPIEENYYNAPADNTPAYEENYAPTKAKKKGFGRAASAFAMIWALLLLGVFVVAYLAETKVLPELSLLAGLGRYDVISNIISLCKPGEFAAQWNADKANLIWGLVPALTMLLTFIQFIVSFSCLCAGKYSRGYNVFWTLLIFAGSALSLLLPVFTENAEFKALFTGLIDRGEWLALAAVAGLGFLAFFTALCSLGVKNPNKQRKAKSVE